MFGFGKPHTHAAPTDDLSKLPQKAPRRATTKLPKITQAQVKTEIAGGLFFGNLVFTNVVPIPPRMEGDELDEQEVEMLADALAYEIVQHPEINAFFARIGTISPHLQLVMAAGLIALPRLVARGYIPALTAMGIAGVMENVRATARSMATGRTPSTRRGHRNRENDFSFDTARDTAVLDSDKDESGSYQATWEGSENGSTVAGQPPYPILTFPRI